MRREWDLSNGRPDSAARSVGAAIAVVAISCQPTNPGFYGGTAGSMRLSDVPFSPRRFPFFYGWVIGVVGTIGIVCSIPGQTMGVSVFTDDLIAALAISRVDLSNAYMWGTLASGCLLPFAGRLYDLWGARVMVVFASAGLGATLWFLSQCDRTTEGLVPYFRESLERREVAWMVITAGFFSLRFWGQGVLTMVSRAMLVKWFQRHRGIVCGFSGAVVSATFAGAPKALARIVEALGWRGSLLLLGVWIGLGMLLLGWIFYRDNPEACGLRMDGAAEGTEEVFDRDRPNPTTVREFGLLEALKTFSFWSLNYTVALPAMIGTAMTFHIGSFGRSADLGLEEATALFVPMAIVAIFTSMVGGKLSDRVRIRYLALALVLGELIGCAGLLAFGVPAGRRLIFVGMGIAHGLFGVLTAVVWPRFYGRKHLGAIASVNLSVIVCASAVGPYLFARLERPGGDYGVAVFVSMALCMLAIPAVLAVRNPQTTDGS